MCACVCAGQRRVRVSQDVCVCVSAVGQRRVQGGAVKGPTTAREKAAQVQQKTTAPNAAQPLTNSVALGLRVSTRGGYAGVDRPVRVRAAYIGSQCCSSHCAHACNEAQCCHHLSTCPLNNVMYDVIV